MARARRAGQHAFHDLDEAADEAYQEAWLELVRRPAPAVGDPAGYLAGIMWHRFHRLELRPVRAPAAPLDDRLASRDPAPEEVAAAREALGAVQEALTDLPERERAAVLLRSLGLGLDDVAASLGVSARRARKLSDSGHRRLAGSVAAASAGERCTAVASTLRALSLGWEIAGRRRTRLERHLAACPGCRATVAALRREGRLAVLPIALAGGSDEGARGLVEHAAQTLARAWDRAGAESALGGTAAGGALATKLAAGCVAVGVAAGCVAVAVRDEPPPVPPPARAQAVTAPAQPVDAGHPAPLRAATHAGPRASRAPAVAKTAADTRRALARSQRRVRKAKQAVRAAQEKTRQAQQRTQQAQQKTQQAQQKTEQAQQNIADAQAKVDQATSNVEQALEKAFGGAP